MRKKTTFVLILALLLLPLLFSCQDKNKDPESIHLASESFSNVYGVDQELDLSNAYLRVIYPRGKYKDIPCSEAEIVGFDTSTTGQKGFYAVYEGLSSNVISYYVYNEEDASREIITRTRVTVTKTISDEKTTFEFGLRSCELDIRAFAFRISGDVNFNDGLGDLTGTPNGTMTDFYWEKTTTDGINVLLSGREAMNSGAFFTF
ncbi:MAG: hypothetical protein J5781_00465, partial [Clostridia bacterium]|nr:hypothetical protein [Clostridia bacterium]